MTEPLAMASKARHNVEVMVLLATMVLDDVVFLKAMRYLAMRTLRE